MSTDIEVTDPTWVSKDEASKILGVSQKTVQRMCSDGRLSSEMRGKRVVIDVSTFRYEAVSEEETEDGTHGSVTAAAIAGMKQSQAHTGQLVQFVLTHMKATHGQLLEDLKDSREVTKSLREEVDSMRELFQSSLDSEQVRTLEMEEFIRKQSRRDQLAGVVGSLIMKKFSADPTIANAVTEFFSQRKAIDAAGGLDKATELLAGLDS